MRKKMNNNGFRNNNNRGGGRGKFRNGGGGGGGGQDAQSLARQKKHAQTQKDKYASLAREALGNGDRVEAEYYFQHVEHYTRVLAEIAEREPQPREPQLHDDAEEGDDAVAESAAGEDDDGAEGRQSDGQERQPREQRQSRPQHQRQRQPREQRQRQPQQDENEIPLPLSMLPPVEDSKAAAE